MFNLHNNIVLSDYCFPIYGYHEKLGTIHFYNENEFNSFLHLMSCQDNSYKYKGALFAHLYQQAHNIQIDYGFVYNSEDQDYEYKEIKQTLELYWVFWDTNDERFPIIQFIENYIFQHKYRKKYFYIEQKIIPGKPVRGTGRVKFKKYKGKSFEKSCLIENDIKKELHKMDNIYYHSLCNKKDAEKTRKKHIKKLRDGQSKSWKIYRKHQWKA